MKKLFKKIFLLALVLVVMNIGTNIASAADLNMGLMNVTPMQGNYIVTTTLQPVDISSFANLTLIGLIDPNDMNPPITDHRNIMISLNNQGYIPVSMSLNYDPAGYAFQFCLVDNLSLTVNAGSYMVFDPNTQDPSNYQVFACTQISWYQPGNQDGGNNGEGNTAQYQFQSSNTQLVISGDLTLNNGTALITINSLDGNELAASEASTNGSGVFSHTFTMLTNSGIVAGQQYTFSVVNADNESQVFLTNQPINFAGSGGGDTNPQDGFNPAEDCYQQEFADTQPCIDFFAQGGDYNPNFILTSNLQNPLGEDGDIDIIAFLQKLFNVMVKVALPFLILFAIYSGFLFVEARGNTDKLEVAKKNFLYVIIGAFIIFGAWMIATALKGTIDDITAMKDIIKDIIKLT